MQPLALLMAFAVVFSASSIWVSRFVQLDPEYWFVVLGLGFLSAVAGLIGAVRKEGTFGARFVRGGLLTLGVWLSGLVFSEYLLVREVKCPRDLTRAEVDNIRKPLTFPSVLVEEREGIVLRVARFDDRDSQLRSLLNIAATERDKDPLGHTRKP